MTPVVGLFGKLPARGDFVRLDLPGSFVQPWDAWLSAGVAAARAHLNDDWQAAWFEAPVWCFTLAGGVCGPDAAAGVLLPSLDRVGRLFPLTLACVGAVPEDAAWFAAAEEICRAAIEHDADPADLLPRLAELPAAAGMPTPGARFWTDGAPRVDAGAHEWPALPPPEAFVPMVAADPAVPA
jgi:type VI secretion system protein ImpM